MVAHWASRLIVATLIFLTWWWVILSAAAPRTSDNGVFLSVASAIAQGVPLYEGVVAAPIAVLGIAYQPGMMNLPGTALVLLGMGLLASRAWRASGFVFALAVVAKITTIPVVIANLVVTIALPHMRKRGF